MAPVRGSRVVLRDAFLDEAMTRPVIGIVEYVFHRSDWEDAAFVVMFDHDDPLLPRGGEFSASRLIEVSAA